MSNVFTEEQMASLEGLANDIEGHLQTAVVDAGTNDHLTQKLIENLSFYGKTLKQWEDELVVIIVDEDLNYDRIQKITLELIKKIQIASHFYTISNTAHVINQTGISIKKSDLITSLISYYHINGTKVPPSSLMDKIAENYIRKLTNIETLSKVVRDFWKHKVETLDKVKSLVSSLGISMVSEMKYAAGAD